MIINSLSVAFCINFEFISAGNANWRTPEMLIYAKMIAPCK